MKYLLSLILACFTFSNLSAQDAMSALREGNYEEAIKRLSGDLTALAAATEGVNEDELRLYQARAHHLAGRNGEAVKLCNEFLKKFPESSWRHKVVFLKAQALAAQRKFEEALAIYQSEAGRIFKEERQDEVAGHLVEFAELFATEPAPEDLDAPRADYEKALILLAQVLDTDCSAKLREEVRSRMVALDGLLQKWEEAEKASLAYLDEFDPSWRGPFGSVRRLTTEKNTKVVLDGPSRFKVRFHHAEALHRRNQRPMAVRYLRELEELTKDKPGQAALRADAMWLRLMAMTKKGVVEDVDHWGENARAYLVLYPNHIWATQVAYKIASVYRGAENWEKARGAYQDYLDGKGYQAPAARPLTMDTKSAGEFEKRKRQHGERREAASFEIGAIFLAEKKFDEAEAQWGKTAKDFPNGEKWADCQKGLVQVDFERALESVRKIHKAKKDKQAAARATARKSLENFLMSHPLDNRLPQLMFALGEISYFEAASTDDEEEFQLTPERKRVFEKAIADWRRLVSKYPQSEQAKAAELKIGGIYEHYLGDLEKAVEVFSGIPNGGLRKGVLMSKALRVFSPRVFGTEEKPEVTLELRNIEEVTVRQYWIDFESFFRKSQNLSDIEKLDVDLVEPDRTWEVKIPDYQRYLVMKHNVEIPFENSKAGVCVIKVEGGGLESTTVAVRSDIDLAVRGRQGEALVFVRDWKIGKVAPGVKLVLADGAKVLANGVSGDDGVWHYKNENLNEVSDLRVLGISERGMAGHSLRISGSALPVPLTSTGILTTSRQIHRPGESVNLKLVVRDVKDGGMVPPGKEERKFVLKVRNEEGRLLTERNVTLNDFGTSQVKFSLPRELRGSHVKLALEGVVGGEKKVFEGTVMVSHEGLPWVKLSLEVEKSHLAPGEVIKGKVTANYRWGAPVGNRKVELKLPGGLIQELLTDENGEVTFEYPTKDQDYGDLIFGASVPSSDSGWVSKNVRVVARDTNVTARLAQALVIAGREIEIALTAKNLDGAPQARDLKVVVERQVETHPDPVLVQVPGLEISRDSLVVSEVVKEQTLKTDVATGAATARFKIMKGGGYFYKVYDGDQVVTSGRLRVSDSQDPTKLRLFSRNEELSEGMIAKFELHSRIEKSVPAVVTIETGRIREYRVIEVKPGSNELSVPLTEHHTPMFHVNVMILEGRKLHQAFLSSHVTRELDVELALEGVEDAEVEPGQKVRVKVSVKDLVGKPVKGMAALAIVRKDDFPKGLTSFPIAQQRQYTRIYFGSGSSCGFQHQGGQSDVYVFAQDEDHRQSVSQSLIANYLNQQVQSQTFSGSVLNGQTTNVEYLDEPILNNPSLGYEVRNNGRQGVPLPVIGAKTRTQESEDFRSGSVVTNADGEAFIEMVLPNEADDWTLLGEVLTMRGRLGLARKRLEIREDFTVRLALPGSVFEGDTFIPSVVVSRSSSEKAVRGMLRLAGPMDKPVEKRIRFKKSQKTLEVNFPKIKGSGDAMVFLVELNIAGQKKSEKQKLSVHPWGASTVDRAGVLAAPGKSRFELFLPEGAIPNSMRMTIQADINQALLALAGSGLEPVLDLNGPRLGGHPSGELLSQLALANYAKKRSLEKKEWDLIHDRIEKLIAILVVRQGKDGGWSSLLGREKSDLAISAIAYEALVKARALEHAVDEHVLNQALSYLKASISKAKGDNRALIHQALASGGLGDFSACNRLFRARAELSAFGQAHLAMAFIHLKRPEFAKDLLENLGKVRVHDVRTLGRALQGWSAIDVNAGKALSLEKEMWDLCGSVGFSDDLSRGIGVLGLTAVHEIRETKTGDFRATVVVNGNEVAMVRSDPEEKVGSFLVDPKILKKGENEVSIVMEGVGRVRVGATLSGFLKTFPKEDWNGDLKIISREFYNPGLSYRGLPLETIGRSPVKKVPVGERVRVRIVAKHSRNQGGEVVIWEKIPAGFTYVKGSLSGVHSGAWIENGYLVITHVGASRGNKEYFYQLVAKTPGEWRLAPTTILPLDEPSRACYGAEGKLTVIPQGKETNEPYVHQVRERYLLASFAFRDGDFDSASAHLAIVRKDFPNYQAAEVARMTLWIETSKVQPDARLVADSFEVLNELSPELEIPFEKILKVGDAYRELKEFERGMDVFLATLEAGFATESFVGAALEDQGRFLDALDYQTENWMEFPDFGEIANSWFGLAQQVYAKAKDAKKLTPRKGKEKAPNSEAIYLKSVEMLERFRATHPGHPFSDDGAFTIANALFTLKAFDTMVAHSKASQKAYPKSDFAEAFLYLEALGNFWLRNYDAAFSSAQGVAEGSGKDRNLAAYICAQVLHAQGKTVDALKWYEKVKDEYPDARDSIAWFEQKKIEFDEVKVIRSGEKVELKLNHRNIKTADLQIYRVDLMKLYLREKNLSNISQVNLAGISPKHEMSVELKGDQFTDHETKLVLPVEKDGAYLIICRGDYLYTSGLVLVTPLKMEAQENAIEGFVRVNMIDRGTGKLLDGVHVKAIGSGNDKFVSGETDLRGVWKAEGLKGAATVIARDQEGRYAFYRGANALGMASGRNRVAPVKRIEGTYNSNNYLKQDLIIRENGVEFEKLRRSRGKGVKVNKAIKK